jgi:hypothetical protein
MAKNWAIVIGINEYSYLEKLKFAKTDAEAMHRWLGEKEKGGFDPQGLFLFTDDSEPIPTDPPIPTEPTFGHLDTFFDVQFERPFLTIADNLWFFFSGHGNRGSGGDYLMLSDSNPRRLEQTALSVSYITERLRNWGAGNVVMFIDACRNVENQAKGGTITIQDYQGMIAFYSCRDKEKSLEIQSKGRGAFTHVLLQALEATKRENKCLTVAELEKYLMAEVPKLSPNQHPLARVEPTYKSNFILFGEAQKTEIESLKNLAYRKLFEDKKEEARELLLHANLAAKGGDYEIIDALGRLSSLTPQTVASPPTQDKLDSSPQPKLVSEKLPASKEVELKSEKGVDYTKLRDLLAEGKWQEADQETAKVMCQAAGREKQGWLDIKSIDNFPCEDLRTINQLWLHYSKGKFGFSVQKEIYESLGGKREYNEEVWKKFGDHVGWRKGGKWLSYSDLTFNVDVAPSAHLPLPDEGGGFGRKGGFVGWLRKPLLFSRAKTCDL